jgi:hypothetical protein
MEAVGHNWKGGWHRLLDRRVATAGDGPHSLCGWMTGLLRGVAAWHDLPVDDLRSSGRWTMQRRRGGVAPAAGGVATRDGACLNV